ncbi:hypothetical protein [Halobacterium wangiae]|uniref:hypothetical protein n=1 Tax=Halobacterium wangiae TaxID=2902623 RepID=UPI001E6567A7|nr:hypothetical protein [Halobacterium wangiae]
MSGNGNEGGVRSSPNEPQQPRHGSKSVTDLLEEPETKEHVKAIAVTMAVVGVALGLLVFLMGSVGGMELTQDGFQQDLSAEERAYQDKQYTANLVNSVFQNAPFVAFGIAAVAGLLVGARIGGGSRKAMVAAGAGALVGTVALVFFAEFLAAQQMPTFENQSGFSLDTGQALINSVVFGVLAAAMASGGAWSVKEYVT